MGEKADLCQNSTIPSKAKEEQELREKKLRYKSEKDEIFLEKMGYVQKKYDA